MKTQIPHLITGGLGLTASVVASDAIPTDPADASKIVSLIVQVVIAIATLLKLFKKKNK